MNHFIVDKIYRKSSIIKINQKLILSGINKDATSYLNHTILFMFIVFLIFTLFLPFGFILGIVASLLIYYIRVSLILNLAIKKRSRILDHDAIFFFQVFALTLDSNKNIKNSLELTTKNVNSLLSNYFKDALEEMKLGRSLKECLKDLQNKIPSQTINIVILHIIEAIRFGTDLSAVLYQEVDFLNKKRLLSIKKDVSSIPLKISLIGALIFIPITCLIILVPALLLLW